MLLQVGPVVPLVLVLVDEAVLAQDAVLDVLVVAQHLAQLDLWKRVSGFGRVLFSFNILVYRVTIQLVQNLLLTLI